VRPQDASIKRAKPKYKKQIVTIGLALSFAGISAFAGQKNNEGYKAGLREQDPFGPGATYDVTAGDPDQNWIDSYKAGLNEQDPFGPDGTFDGSGTFTVVVAGMDEATTAGVAMPQPTFRQHSTPWSYQRLFGEQVTS
jgi:hypothetical protein